VPIERLRPDSSPEAARSNNPGGGPCPALDSFYRLRRAELPAGKPAREERLRCPVDAAYLERHLL
jgi:hypothetical protein